MIQGTATQNSNIVDYGAEGLTYPTNSFVFINNQMQNTLPNAIGINDPNGVAVVGNGNTFAPSITTQVNPSSANQLTGSSNSQITPDGTVSLPPNGASLTTSAGTWSWGPPTTYNPAACGGNCYQIYLNGSYAANGGNASKMEVAHGRQLYAFNSYGFDATGWYVWNGVNYSVSAAP